MKVRPARRPDALGITVDGEEIEFKLDENLSLYCPFSNLKSLEINNKNIKFLYCIHNQLTSLNVTGLTNLRQLTCEYNQLTSLNISGLTNLVYLDYDENKTKLIGKETIQL